MNAIRVQIKRIKMFNTNYNESYCSEMKRCVTGTGNWKIYFSSAIKLTVESSKILQLIREKRL